MSGQAAEKADATTDLTTSERPLHDYVAEVSERTDVRVGVPLPLGTYARGEGVNFAFFSRHASRVRLELFDHPEDAAAARVIDLDPARNRTGDVWHVWIEGIRPGQLYAYRVDGPYQPRERPSFQFQQASPGSLRDGDLAVARLGVWPGSWIRSVGAGRETRCVRRSTMPAPCRNAYSRRSIFTGMTTGRPGIPGRRPSFMKRMCAASPSIPAPAWSIPAHTEA